MHNNFLVTRRCPGLSTHLLPVRHSGESRNPGDEGWIPGRARPCSLARNDEEAFRFVPKHARFSLGQEFDMHPEWGKSTEQSLTRLPVALLRGDFLSQSHPLTD